MTIPKDFLYYCGDCLRLFNIMIFLQKKIYILICMRRNVRCKKFDLCLGWGYMWNKHILVLLYEHFNLINALQCKTPIRCKNRINHLSLRIILVFLLFAKMFKKFKILCAKKRKIWECKNSSFQWQIELILKS